MHKLVRLLEKVENPGTFSVSGSLPATPPGLKVKGLGNIALPLLPQQAEALIQLSEQAPFGRGEETIVDTNVRNVWQISTENFELSNPAWQTSLQAAVEQIGKQLGLHNCKITFEPYKLLLYGKGSFFTSHRDTEKIPNMFATLVINLPSEHEGGELIISHAGQSQRYSFADANSFDPRFVAFYADCYHEVTPITSGYRICLIYNLAIANRKQQPLLSQQLQVAEQVNDALRDWLQQEHETPLLAYLLEHDYSEQNLSLENLKNGDFAKALLLMEAGEKNGCQAFLCLVTYFQTSYGETAYRGRYSRYSDEEDEEDEEDFEEYEVDSEEMYAHAFVSAYGTRIAVEKLRLDEDEILAKTALLDGPGRGFSIMEATGNEGATKELWYHRGAVILWRKENEFDLIRRMDISYAVHRFQESIRANPHATGEERAQIIRLAQHVIKNLESHSQYKIVNDLVTLGDLDLLKDYIQKQMYPHSIRWIDEQEFVTIVERFGWQPFAQIIEPLLTPQREASDWLASLVIANPRPSKEGQTYLKQWVTTLWKPTFAYKLSGAAITNLVILVTVLQSETVAAEMLAFLAEQKQADFLTTTYAPAIVKSRKTLSELKCDQSLLQMFIEDVRQQIASQYPTPPTPPADWSREGQLNCTCEFCSQVNRMLPDARNSGTTIYKTLKRNLLHVQSEIEKSQVDVDVTIRSTPPKFDGTFRKNRNSYEKQRKLYDQAQGFVKELGGGGA